MTSNLGSRESNEAGASIDPSGKPYSHQWRESLLPNHPILTKRYLLVTPAIERARDISRERFALRRTGTVFCGIPRLGKTRCSRALVAAMKAEFPNAYVLWYTADTGSTSRDTGLFADLLEADDVLPKKKRPVKEHLRHLLTHIPSELARIDGTQFLLYIDEMQLLTEAEYKQLLVLGNRLEQRGVAMSTIGFAQPGILEVREGMIATRSLNLIARFLGEPIEFQGCATSTDLESILGEYDEGSTTYPEDFDCTYTQFFLPMAYAVGFRLRRHATAIYKELSEAAAGIGTCGIPMEHVALTVEMLLLENRFADAAQFTLSEEAIKSAVLRSNLRSLSGVLASAGGEGKASAPSGSQA